jgi:SH3 domain protein
LVRLTLLLSLFFALMAANAQTMFVTDELVITLRTGPSNQNRVVGNLESGDRVEVLEEDVDGDYARVRVTSSGLEGWLLRRYLVAQPTAALRLADAEDRLDDALTRTLDLEERLTDSNTALKLANDRLDGLASSNSELSAELTDIRTASANAIALREQNESLRRRVNEMTIQAEALAQENAELAGRSRQNWFVVGAAVLAMGIVIGLVAPTLRRRRKDW